MKQFKPAFTLVEILVYMGLLSIFLVTLTDIFSATLKSKLESQSYSVVDQDAKFIFSRLAYDIARADSITTPVPGTRKGNLILNIGPDTFEYRFLAGKLQLTTSTGTTIISAPDILIPGTPGSSTLYFQNVGNALGKDSIIIRATLNSKIVKSSGQQDSRLLWTTTNRR